jgi:hypothetical protein
MTILVDPNGQPLVGVAPRPTGAPFDKTNGEEIGDLGRNYVVAPLSKWANTPLMDAAVDRAMKVWARKATNTTIPKIQFDEDTILIQEYHARDLLLILNAQWGRQMGMRNWGWLYFRYPLHLAPDLRAHLVMQRMWPSLRERQANVDLATINIGSKH